MFRGSGDIRPGKRNRRLGEAQGMRTGINALKLEFANAS